METSLDFKRDIKRCCFKLDGLVVVPSRDLVLMGEREYALEPLVMDLLCILAERPGDVMMREELISRLWDIDHGGDENLTRAVSVLRKALREAGPDEEYVETIPKRGYRLTHPISQAEDAETHLEFNSRASAKNNKGSLMPTILVIFIVSIPILIIAAIGI